MPTYDYRCRTCDASFEVQRSLSDVSQPTCPQGHVESIRVWNAVAVGGTASAPAPSGGCCGGGCCG